MGNDGGSIPKRRELVKEAARNPTSAELKETLQEQHEHLWSIDPLSQRPLSKPIVSDSLGRLFNKDSIIEFLLPADEENAVRRAEQEALLQGTVKSLKDIVEMKFEVDETATATAKRRQSPNARTEVWVCPITREELGPATKTVYLVPCGHVFSASAVKEVSGEHCLQCNESYASNDIIPILPTAETDLARLTLRMKTLKEKGLAHSLKKTIGGNKKRKKDVAHGIAESEAVSVNAPPPVRISMLKEDHELNSPRHTSAPPSRSGTSTPKPSEGIKNAATASLTAKVLQEQEERNKRRKMEGNQNLSSLYTSKSGGLGEKKHRDIDFMNRGISLARN